MIDYDAFLYSFIFQWCISTLSSILTNRTLFIQWTQIDKSKFEICWSTDVEYWNPHYRGFRQTSANKWCWWRDMCSFPTEDSDEENDGIGWPCYDETTDGNDDTWRKFSEGFRRENEMFLLFRIRRSISIRFWLKSALAPWLILLFIRCNPT